MIYGRRISCCARPLLEQNRRDLFEIKSQNLNVCLLERDRLAAGVVLSRSSLFQWRQECPCFENKLPGVMRSLR